MAETKAKLTLKTNSQNTKKIKKQLKDHRKRLKQSKNQFSPSGQELKRSIKIYNTDNIPRNINTKCRPKMDQKKEYLYIFRKADPNINKSKHKITDPLFLLKLHFHMRNLPNFIDLYKQITEDSQLFILNQIKEFEQSQKALEQEEKDRFYNNLQNQLYFKKFTTFRKFLYYLRNQDKPKLETLKSHIENGIYDTSKYPKVKAKVEQLATQYKNGQ